jgi:choice-of-anchor B domain-containing protein
MHRRRRTIVGVALAAALLVTTIQPASGHPVHDFGGDSLTVLKGRHYDGVVEDISPGGVPMEALSDVRCEDGMAGIFPCHKVDLASFTPLPDMEATFVNDIWGWEDSATGMQVAIVGSFEGTAFIDVTDGTNPVYLGTLPTTADPNDIGNIWGDIRVYEDTAYIVSEALDFSTYDPAAGTIDGFGIQVVDLTQFRGAAGPIDIALTNLLDDVSQSHNVSLNEDTGRLYVVGSYADVADECAVAGPLPVLNGTGGALIYDVATDPHNPQLVGCMNNDGYTHDIHCVVYAGPDADYQDREICIASNEDTVTIYDATDPANTSVIDRLTYYEEGLVIGQVYTHQGWWSEDQSYFFLSDELDELAGTVSERTTYIWDVRDLDNAQVIGTHSDGNTSIDHNMFVLDGLLYQSNYTSGLWIYDAWKADQGRVTMRGYFDIFPSDDNTAFFGTWGNYPFFGDGKVVVTSSDEGVFVLQSRAKSSSTDKGRRAAPSMS